MKLDELWNDMRNGDIGQIHNAEAFGKTKMFVPLPPSTIDALENVYKDEVEAAKPDIRHTRVEAEMDMDHIIYNGMIAGNGLERPKYIKKVGDRYYIANYTAAPIVLDNSLNQISTVDCYGATVDTIRYTDCIDATQDHTKIMITSQPYKKLMEFANDGSFIRNVLVSSATDDPQAGSVNYPMFAQYTAAGDVIVVSRYGGTNNLGVIAKFSGAGTYVNHIDSYNAAGGSITYMKIIDGYIYVLCKDQITILDEDLNIITRMYKPRGFEASDFDLRGICVDASHIYVASYAAGKIYKIDKTTQSIIDSAGIGMFLNSVDIIHVKNAIQGVFDIEMSPSGDIIVCDYNGNLLTIIKFSDTYEVKLQSVPDNIIWSSVEIDGDIALVPMGQQASIDIVYDAK